MESPWLCGARRCLLAAACFAVCFGATSSAMGAPRFDPVCGHSTARFTRDLTWDTRGPYWLAMSQHTAASIERQMVGGRYTKQDLHAARCSIAANVAYVAMEAWENWDFNRGSVEVTTTAGDRTARPWLLGRFSCTGMTTGWDGAIETCRHPSDRHEGLILVQFAINPT